MNDNTKKSNWNRQITAADLYNIPNEEEISNSEFDSRLMRSVNGLKLIHEALLSNDGDISAVLLCDGLEPFLRELYEIEARYSNHGGFNNEEEEAMKRIAYHMNDSDRVFRVIRAHIGDGDTQAAKDEIDKHLEGLKNVKG